MSLIEHLEELRKRIIISVVALAVTTAGAFICKSYLLAFLVAPLNGKQLITLAPAESFMTAFKVSAYVGVIAASPIIIYQIWAFVAPGLKSKEKHVVLYAAAFTTILFLSGVAFAWWLVLPRGLDFLLNYQSDYFNQQVQASKYFSFVAMFLLGFGIIFELPALLLTLARLGIVNSKQLAKNRRYAILAGAVISAFLTPTQDVISMMAMAVPFVFLYEISIHLSRLVQKRKQERSAEVVEGPEGEAAS
jgi:sec-independent protein translocase protein TatC